MVLKLDVVSLIESVAALSTVSWLDLFFTPFVYIFLMSFRYNIVLNKSKPTIIHSVNSFLLFKGISFS